MTRSLSAVGIILTLVYIIGLCIFFEGRVAEIRGLAPNNVGDFLAGVFGPVAILWLILGYFQQGVELKQNTRALELQAEELRNSVEQQRELVEITRRQVDAELSALHAEQQRQREAAQPKFVFHGAGGIISGGKATYTSTVKNLGNTATEVTISTGIQLRSHSFGRIFSWSRNEERRFEWSYLTDLAEEPMQLTVSYVDAAGVPGTQAFQVTPNLARDHHMVEIMPIAG
ncbi:hypothetical protein [uncultured Xanthomonas sp.]|uniref:hypothetical protein n=1 Tax=uncultured Xanthomonas sp. TaxID=152831 RepID=UPI0025F028C9|nr:hypothetical protein [uncultured Xanthomonas sp.]KAB7772126.1 hypothetical protein CEK69_08750 [Xanthomonas sp. LMG 12462]MCW0390253.1 hypothetical protein [Xanthomonas sacchari]MCW0455772.1 hypothetical protein [Xanthomonas sacchari]